MNSRDLNDEGRPDTEAEAQDRWKKHVVVAIWISLGVLVVVATILLYAEAHGFLGSSGHSASGSIWPGSLP